MRSVQAHRTKQGTKVFKRCQNSRNYVLRKKVGYHDHYFNLGANLKEAKQLADKISNYLVFNSVEDARKHFYPNEVLIGDDVPSIAEVLKWMRKAAKLRDLSPATVKAYEVALRQVAYINIPELADTARERAQQKEEVLGLPVSCINQHLFGRFREYRLATRGESLSVKRSINSILQNARSVFHENLSSLYPRWKPIWTQEFMRLKGFRATTERYTLPPTELIAKTFEELDQIEGPVWAYITLALRGGMRRSEIINAKQNWVEPAGTLSRIYIYPTDEFRPKGKSGYTEISSFLIREIQKQAGDSEYLCGLDNTYLRETVMPKQATELLRSWGWQDYQKPLHELRKIFGAVIATTQGLYAAQKMLRHAKPQLTSDTYADRVVDEEVLRRWGAA